MRSQCSAARRAARLAGLASGPAWDGCCMGPFIDVFALSALLQAHKLYRAPCAGMCIDSPAAHTSLHALEPHTRGVPRLTAAPAPLTRAGPPAAQRPCPQSCRSAGDPLHPAPPPGPRSGAGPSAAGRRQVGWEGLLRHSAGGRSRRHSDTAQDAPALHLLGQRSTLKHGSTPSTPPRRHTCTRRRPAVSSPASLRRWRRHSLA